MLSLTLALQLRDAGLRWSPARGDRFVLPNRGMDEDVFVVSDMTVDVHEFPSGAVIGFNGVTEWALDSVQQQDALWIPSEEQLRECLAGLFRSLEVIDGRYVVTVTLPDGVHAHDAVEVSDAYGRALLGVLSSLGD